MVTTFSSKSVNDAWKKAAVALSLEDSKSDRLKTRIKQRLGRGGGVREILHCAFSIANPHQHWVTARNPPINPAFAIAEVVGLLAGVKEAEFYNYWNRQLPSFAGNTSIYEGCYGVRLHKHYGINQLQLAYDALSNNPTTRQVVLQYYDVRYDLPKHRGEPSSADVPCNIISLLKIRDNKLEWTQIVRSNDVFLGIPYNFTQFTYLHEIMAGWLGLQLGSYIHFSDSLHVYSKDSRYLSPRSEVKPKKNTDRFKDSFNITIDSFEQIHKRLWGLISGSKSINDHIRIVEQSDESQPYLNFIRVLIAESARRNKYYKLSEQIMEKCTNPCLLQVWERWLNRMSVC